MLDGEKLKPQGVQFETDSGVFQTSTDIGKVALGKVDWKSQL